MTKVSFNKKFRQAAYFMSCLFLFSCENSQRSLDEWRERRDMVEEGRDIQTFFSQGGRMRARLTAPLMYRYTRDTVYVDFPKTLKVVFYDSLLRPESTLQSLRGKYYESLRKAYLQDSVVVANINGDTLWAPDLWWDQNSQKFYTDKQVRIYRGGDRIYGGKGLEAKQDLSGIIIRQPTGTVVVPDSLTAQ